MLDVLVVGAGPAGSVAATVLARAGARVLVVDRARFPRDKLCGDTLNPGTLGLLDRLGLGRRVEQHGLRLDGMIVTGEGGVRIEGPYGARRTGRAVSRRDLDGWLLAAAIEAGARFEEGVRVHGPLLSPGAGGTEVRGVRLTGRDGRTLRMPALVTIAADGRRSALAFSLGLSRHPARPRRWAVGGYFDGVRALTSFGEMHVRSGGYIGVAPLPDGRANACLVSAGRHDMAAPAERLIAALRGDAMLQDRFDRARLVDAPMVVGPLAVDAAAAGAPGLLLAGDAAGFVDPMTGDGLRFAIRGGELAARAALETLRDGRSRHRELAGRRAREFSRKWRFNRLVRALVDTPAGVRAGTAAARLAPGVLRYMIRVAADLRV